MTDIEKIEKAIRVMQQHKCEEISLYGEEYNLAISALEEIQQYRSIGTVSECREAREKQKEKKPIARNDDRKIYMCQCGNTQINTMDNYCGVCGQAIDWSDTP